LLQLLLAKPDPDLGFDAALPKDSDGGGGQLIGNQYAGHAARPLRCHAGLAGSRTLREPTQPAGMAGAHAALASDRLASRKAHSSHGVRASISATSTVEPHQIRKCGGASRWPATSWAARPFSSVASMLLMN